MKICQVNNCIYSVFGTDKNTGYGYCKRHQYLRTDKKPKKHTQKTHIKDFNFGFKNQADLFNWLWCNAKNEKEEIICRFTGEKLNRFYNTSLYWSCFAHVLPKGQYIYFRLNPKNVEIVFPEFHIIIDQGTNIDRMNHPNWKFDLWDQRKEELKIEYKLFKKQNLLA